MRLQVLAAVGLLLCGCAVFDPAPYDPTRPATVASRQPPVTPADPLGFDGLGDSVVKLTALSRGYADRRDAIMREQLGFDLALLGLTTAVVVNPIYHGARAVTVALGLGAATVGAGRVYFAPQQRAAAYNGAALALACAASVARRMSRIAPTDDAMQALRTDLAAANALLLDGDAKGPTGAALVAARDRAQLAFARLVPASALLRDANARLEVFAAQTVRATTSKVVGGAQNLDAALAMLKAASPASPGAPAPVTASKGGPQLVNTPGAVAVLTGSLDTDAAAADQLATAINDAWSPLQACTSGGA